MIFHYHKLHGPDGWFQFLCKTLSFLSYGTYVKHLNGTLHANSLSKAHSPAAGLEVKKIGSREEDKMISVEEMHANFWEMTLFLPLYIDGLFCSLFCFQDLE